jgi:hypothetical protein
MGGVTFKAEVVHGSTVNECKAATQFFLATRHFGLKRSNPVQHR